MILLIDDDYSVTASLGLLLRQAGYETLTAATPAEARAHLRNPALRLVLQDMNFSRRTTGEEGLTLLREIKSARPELPVVLITAWGSIALAVEGMKAGAADFITKPWSNAQILQVVETALGLARVSAATDTRPTREDLDAQYDTRGVVGRERGFVRVLELVCRVAETGASVLITGESGAGKEVIAELIHRNSRRREGPLVKVNLGGIPAGLFESEMFGHVKGAFTDAQRDRQGRFAVADGGTIFLDEIGELDPACQVKLLRVLQDRTYEVLGSSTTRKLDVRVVSASNRDLVQAVQQGSFREDLLYRINLISVHVPPLSERRSDIPVLARHFLGEMARAYGKADITLSEAAATWLQGAEWPGNVRHLRQHLERAVLLADAPVLEPVHFQRVRHMDALHSEDADSRTEAAPLPEVGSMTLDEIERAMILKSLQHHAGNLSRVAESLGMSRAALYRRLDKYGIRT